MRNKVPPVGILMWLTRGIKIPIWNLSWNLLVKIPLSLKTSWEKVPETTTEKDTLFPRKSDRVHAGAGEGRSVVGG
jgi:hypothetical protein